MILGLRVSLLARIVVEKKMFEKELNEEQLIAVSHMYGPCLVSACPGAGKTRVIAYRSIFLLKNNINPNDILLVTFTNKAAREMKERIIKLSSSNGVSCEGMHISTFHSFCLEMLRQGGSYNSVNYEKINILDEDDCISFLKNICNDRGVDLEKSDLKIIKSSIDNLREQCLSYEEIMEKFSSDSFKQYIYEKYINGIKAINCIDFSGIMYDFYCRLISDVDFKNKISNKFKFVMIDEVQDTNIIQFKIAKIISSVHGNIFMVGDTDQSIYQWRGANPSQVGDFVKNNSCKLYRLTKNYRCTSNITDLASNIISYNKNRLNEKIIAHRDSGEPVNYNLYINRDEEANNIGKKIIWLKSSGEKFKDIAVLVRASHLTRSIEQSLMSKNIPYSVTGGFRFFDREEIKDIICMLKFIYNRSDVLSFSRFMNKPKRGLGGRCVQAISNIGRRGTHPSKIEKSIMDCDEIKDAQKNSICNLVKSLLSINIEACSISDIIKHAVGATCYKNYIQTFSKDICNDKSDNIEELISSVESSGQTLGEFLHSVSLMSTPKEANEEDSQNSVKIMTMHAAKGLEFKNVFIPCCEEHIMPHRRSLEAGEHAIDEERRLCYVAITRGMDRVFISNSVFSGKFEKAPTMPSRFLVQGGLIDREKYFELLSKVKSEYLA